MYININLLKAFSCEIGTDQVSVSWSDPGPTVLGTAWALSQLSNNRRVRFVPGCTSVKTSALKLILLALTRLIRDISDTGIGI